MTDETVVIRPEIAALAAYRQGRPARADAFKLSSNENPFPPLPAVLDAIGRSTVNRYPDATAAELRGRLAERHGVTPERIQVGAGSVSVLAQLISAVAGAGDEVVFAWRSFEAYPLLVTVAGATAVPVPNRVDESHDLDALAAAISPRTRAVLVCSPNNPTGTIVTAADFAHFMERVPASVLVVLDEAYREFITDPAAVDGDAVLGAYPNLVILRTFSKAYGLAGLRIGYAVGPSYLMDAARSTAIPLSVIEQAQRAALVSLEHEAELLERVAVLAERRDRVRAALLEQGWRVPEAQGNFVWLPTGAETEAVAAVLAEHGLVVRAFPPEGIRVSIGEEESVDRLLSATSEVVPTGAIPPSEPGLD